jgi:endonuclease YncB( thermonuclease family)
VVIAAPHLSTKENRMTNKRKPRFASAVVTLSLVLAWCSNATAGDATYGTVVAVKSATSVTFRHDSGQYDVLVAGLVAPDRSADAELAQRRIDELAVGKRAQFRFDGRNRQGAMVGKIYLDDSNGKVRDLAVELVRDGLAMPAREYAGYKYGELTAALSEARAKKAGLWRNAPQ